MALTSQEVLEMIAPPNPEVRQPLEGTMVREALEALIEEPRRPTGLRRGQAAAALLVAAAVGGVAVLFSTPSSPGAAIRTRASVRVPHVRNGPLTIADGNSIFAVDHRGVQHLLFRCVDAAGAHRFCSALYGIGWSPTRDKLLFTSTTITLPSRFNGMHVLDLRTGKTTRAGVEGLSPDWSRDGRIALVGPTSWPGPIGSISVRRIDGSKATERALVTGTDGHDSSPSWSPDGQRLVFATRRRGESTISIIDSDSSQRQLLARHAASPAWSPDGSAIAYRTPRGAWYRPWPEVSWQPITIGDDGTGRRQITQTDLKDMKQTWNTTLDVLGPPASSPLGAALRNLDKLEGAQSPTGPDVATYRRGIWLGRNGKRIHDQVAAARTYARERHLPMVVKIPQDAKVKVPRKAITGRR